VTRDLGAAPATRLASGLIVTALLTAAVSGLIALLDANLPAPRLMVLYMLVILPVAIGWGTRLAVFAALLSTAVFAFFFLAPAHKIWVDDSQDLIGLAIFLVTAVVVGELTARMRRAAVESERLSREQSALRRVAVLVAEAVEPRAVFGAVTREVGLICDADLARMERYDDGAVVGVAAWCAAPPEPAVGTRLALDGPGVARAVLDTGGPVRVDSFAGAAGQIAREAQELGIRSSVGCPIVVAGRIWGVIAASTRGERPFPAGTESQITSFTELVATAVDNAQSRAELAASRARVVAAADETRRRLERDLHDGAQQRLVALALDLRVAEETVPAGMPELRGAVRGVADELTEVLDELREISRGIHPAILSEGGLRPALRTLARRSPIPVELQVDTRRRFPPAVEVTAYYAVSEALTNTAKHAAAGQAAIVVEERGDVLRLCVSDDGAGGADPSRGSGLVGLRDRVESMGGRIEVDSPAGRGTTITVSLPLTGR
jgi:signal transduction histidine kinase